MAAEQQQDVETLKRRGRRRLVGAVALVLAAVIVLPMVFDPEPRGTAPVSVRIPGEDETPFAPKPPPKKAVEPAKKAEEPVKKAEEPVKKAASAPAAPREEFVVQVGAFANPQAAIAKLKSAKMPYTTESMQGNLTRVRAGPFASREAADKALEQLKALGFQPGAVTGKSG
ncbi:MAG TPA: SPOR domain-containing protein [Burkholderiales bacterium]|nr:SPOR domain-containing protein [Burkholderiales bacterium]